MAYLETLKKDAKLSSILTKVEPYKPNIEKDVYIVLLRSVAGQQLSLKAAATIWERFLKLFPENYPKAEMLADFDAEILRSAGLSYSKAGYMKNIAAFSKENNLSFQDLNKMTDDEIIAFLTQIKGVGKWTVEMLLMFSLGRKDVFPVDDLGIVLSIKKLYKLSEEGKALKQKCIEISNNWKPYRSIACFYLWPYRGMK
jgi:DNA-3-methyladenine glycosylase II